MKRILILLAAFTFFANISQGRERTDEQMQAIASRMLTASASVKAMGGYTASPAPVMALSNEALAVYVPSEGAGFAIVSRNEAYPEVIAYGSAMFSTQQLPCGLQWWLEQTSLQMSRRKAAPSSLRQQTPAKTVAPLIKTKWGQGTPYNNLCPTIGASHAPAGCVATAMAQAVNYNQWPTSVAFNGRYRVQGEESTQTVRVESEYTFPFHEAYNYYYPEGYESDDDIVRLSYTDDEAAAIATLLRDCGFALEMSYTTDGSGASIYNAAQTFVRVLQYSELAVKFYLRAFFTDEEWHQIVTEELMRGYPIIYGGSSEADGGHAFIVHGIDAEGLLCINWGWNGFADGYYNMDLMNPADYHFDQSQHMITGLHPKPLQSDLGQSLLVTPEPYTLRSALGRIAIYFKTPVYNYSHVDLYGNIALVMEDLDDGSVIYDNLMEEGGLLVSRYSMFDGLLRTNATGEKGHRYCAYVASKQPTEAVWQPVRTYGGSFYYNVEVTDAGKYVFSERVDALPVGIRSIESSKAELDEAYSITRVYDASGRLVYSAPSESFNLWDIPARGLLIVKQGNETRKIVR